MCTKIKLCDILYKKVKGVIKMSKHEEKNTKKRWIVIASIVLIIVISGIILYSLQFTIFKSLYENNNDLAKQIYYINKYNNEFKKNVDNLFDNKVNQLIERYKNNEIAYEQLQEETDTFIEYKDFNNKIEMIKKQKEKFEQAEKYFEEKDYKQALPIYLELNNVYGDFTEKTQQAENGLKKSILEQINKLKDEKNYAEAIKIIEEVKDYYTSDTEILNALSELATLQQSYSEQEKENRKIEEIKSSIKVIKVWTASPNSAGGVDLYINWKNLSDKVIKYAYFTITPYNSVNDTVNCTIRHYSSFTAQDEGPYSKGQGTSGTGYCWENAWYNHSIKGAKLRSVRIVYMDGSSLDIPEKYVEYIK